MPILSGLCARLRAVAAALAAVSRCGLLACGRRFALAAGLGFRSGMRLLVRREQSPRIEPDERAARAIALCELHPPPHSPRAGARPDRLDEAPPREIRARPPPGGPP